MYFKTRSQSKMASEVQGSPACYPSLAYDGD